MMTYIKLIVLSLAVAFTACNKYPEANMPNEPLEKPLEIVKEPKIVAMTNSMTAAVKKDGTLWTWGTGSDLLRDIKTPEEGYTPGQVKGVTDAMAVAASGTHYLVLKRDGTVWGWGKNSEGQIDPSRNKEPYISEITKIPNLEGVVDIDADGKTSLFVTKKGYVYLQGDYKPILVDDEENTRNNLAKVLNLKNIVRVDGFGDNLLALNNLGELFAVSISSKGFGVVNPSKHVGKNNTRYGVNKIKFDKKVVDFAIGYGNFALLDDGSVWSWRSNTGGNAAQGKIKGFIQEPRRVRKLSKITKLNAKSANNSSGEIFVWGDYAIKCTSCISTGSSMLEITKPIKVADNANIMYFLKSSQDRGFVDDKGDFWAWGDNRHGIRGTGKRQSNKEMPKNYILTPEKSLWNYYE